MPVPSPAMQREVMHVESPCGPGTPGMTNKNPARRKYCAASCPVRQGVVPIPTGRSRMNSGKQRGDRQAATFTCSACHDAPCDREHLGIIGQVLEEGGSKAGSTSACSNRRPRPLAAFAQAGPSHRWPLSRVDDEGREHRSPLGSGGWLCWAQTPRMGAGLGSENYSVVHGRRGHHLEGRIISLSSWDTMWQCQVKPGQSKRALARDLAG